jgi:mRNA interferase RelE/StbE
VDTILFKLKVPDDVALSLRALHPDLKRKIKGAMKILISTPEAGKVLRDELAGLRSFSVSRFRIIYRINRRTIEIVAVGPRGMIYEETYRLIKLKEGTFVLNVH